MPTPPNIAEATAGWSFESGIDLADDRMCVGARFHSPQPLLLHEVDLDVWSGRKGEQVFLCATCRDNLSVLQDLLKEHNGILPWKVRREFGNQIRALGMRGWGIYSDGVKRGRKRA